MRSTFHGLETARRGMFTQQSALHTTGHNIANANTPGYSRQRVNFSQTNPYPAVGRTMPNMPGQMGTGVEAGTIQRVRENFLDVQYRSENNKLGYWESRADAIEKMEQIMNEPSEEGLSITMDRFWQSLQDLAVNPSNSGARSVVRQRGIAVAETFNYLSNSLNGIQQDLKNELNLNVKELNSLVTQLNGLNKQIAEIEPHGYLPNDLYDERTRLLDSLSKLANIKVTPVKSGGNSLAVAEGRFTVEMVDANGNSIGKLLDGKTLQTSELSLTYDPNNGLVKGFKVGSDPVTDIYKFNTSGKLRSLVDSYGYNDIVGTKGLYPDMIRDLDEMAFEFAQEFNRVHRTGWSISNMKAAENGQPFVEYNFFDFDSSVASPISSNKSGAASALKIDDIIMNSLDHIAASGSNNGLVTTGNFSGYNNGTTNYTNIKVEVKYDGSTYNYEIFDNNTSPATSLKTGNLATDLSTDLNGINIDVTNLRNVKAGSSWTIELPKTGPVKALLGDGSNASALAEVRHSTLTLNQNSTDLKNYYEGVIGEMAVRAQEAMRLSSNSEILRNSVETNRQSVSGVSLDEEMTNMIKFQHAYNASARTITMVDEMLDRIINGLGVGGR
ncbi:flagellar hook-associated protein FlgK [Bacillus timonensis]|nr:flagellar hook-associated protein FlgK [Bacillus timonensis]